LNLSDHGWILAMQEELNQFQKNDVWDLVPKCNALVAILLFLVVGHVLFEFINDYVNMWCVYLFIIIYVK